MRKPEQVERLYLDFDGFFASVEQQVRPELRGRPIGVVPFAGSEHTCVIACSREAKAYGVRNVMPIREAREKCPDIVLVPQSPDLYRRAHNTLLSEISAVIPIDAVKSIDELTCRVAPADRSRPEDLGQRIKRRMAREIGPYITCSIGIAANRQLAKMASKAGKRMGAPYGDGLMVWSPDVMPGPLLPIPLNDVPGVGRRMSIRLMHAGIGDVAGLLATQPKQMRALWRSVTGEHLWYALHGYDVQAEPSERGMYGHGRVLPPINRGRVDAHLTSRLLLIKAARRLRRDGWYASRLSLRLGLRERGWSAETTLPIVRDDHAVLVALEELWSRVSLKPNESIKRIGVTLYGLTPATERQTDLLLQDDRSRQRWETLTDRVDALNRRYGRTVISLGPFDLPAGGNVGGKISYTRIPRAEDFI
jgi:DNA polymerase-4